MSVTHVMGAGGCVLNRELGLFYSDNCVAPSVGIWDVDTSAHAWGWRERCAGVRSSGEMASLALGRNTHV